MSRSNSAYHYVERFPKISLRSYLVHCMLCAKAVKADFSLWAKNINEHELKSCEPLHLVGLVLMREYNKKKTRGINYI